MKGEEVPPYARWGGNPASEMRVPADVMFAKITTKPERRSGRYLLAQPEVSGGMT